MVSGFDAVAFIVVVPFVVVVENGVGVELDKLGVTSSMTFTVHDLESRTLDPVEVKT